jgi:hypothetical protein
MKCDKGGKCLQIIAGSLDFTTKAQFESHLAECPQCRES